MEVYHSHHTTQTNTSTSSPKCLIPHCNIQNTHSSDPRHFHPELCSTVGSVVLNAYRKLFASGHVFDLMTSCSQFLFIYSLIFFIKRIIIAIYVITVYSYKHCKKRTKNNIKEKTKRYFCNFRGIPHQTHT